MLNLLDGKSSYATRILTRVAEVQIAQIVLIVLIAWVIRRNQGVLARMVFRQF